MSFDLHQLVADRQADKVPLFERHLNGQMVRILRTLGFDADYVRGDGAYLFDRDGNKYLDLLSGFGVFGMGRNHPTVRQALHQVLDAEFAGMVQLDVSLLAGLLAEALVKRMPWLDKAYFCNSGAEAVEAAIKFARMATKRSKIIYCEHGYHGLTYGALSVTADETFRTGFDPLLGDCIRIPFSDPVALERALAGGDVAAFIVEPIQGKGVNMPADGYLQDAQALCRKHRTLFVCDEIQTGMGRTGRFLASEHWAVEPDMVLLAKALSGGFIAVGAVLMKDDVFGKVFDRMDKAVVHGSTFSKNDMAMAAGLATLHAFEEEKLVDRAAEQGETLISKLRSDLEGLEFVADVRGKGMMIGIEFGAPKSIKLRAAYGFIEKANAGLFCQLILVPLFKEHRLLAQVAGAKMPVIKLLPPYVVSDADVDWITSAFAQTIKECQHLDTIWGLGRTLAGHALRAQTGSR
jgi:ornithine--oxo-acid transaminase